MKNLSHYHVALIDSGIGGFSVMHEIEQRLPGVGISYFMDNLYLPYGELSESALLARLERIVEFLQQVATPDLIVIACNTASTQSLEFLRHRFDQIFVGVVPAIKPAAAKSKSKHIGLLATPATVNGQYIQGLIENFAQQCKVQKVGSSALVHLAERRFWSEGEVNINDLSFPVFDQVDTVVLGCTHFPLIKDLIQDILPEGVNLIDSGQAIATRVSVLLDASEYKTQSRIAVDRQLFASQSLPAKRQAILNQIGFDSISHVEL